MGLWNRRTAGRTTHHNRRSTRTLGNSRLRIEPLEDRRLLAVFVVDNLDDGDLASLAGDGKLSLREAVEAANTNASVDGSEAGSAIEADQITFAPTLFDPGPAATLTLTAGQLAITESLAIKGPGATVLTIDADNASQIFLIDDGSGDTIANVEISGLTLTGGVAPTGPELLDGHGGAILSLESLALRNSVLTGNTALYGGGAIRTTTPAGGVTIIDTCTISGNAETDPGEARPSCGGGIESTNYGTFTIQNTIVSGNQGDSGGGIYSRNYDGGIATIKDCTISGNTALKHGGGLVIRNVDATITVENCTIAGNQAGDGGGVAARSEGGSVAIRNNTVSGNATKWSGGGVYTEITAGTIALLNSTITGNTADSDNNGQGTGGGVYSSTQEQGYLPVILRSTIVAGNTDKTGTAPDVYGGAEIDYCLIGNDTGATLTDNGHNLIDVDPLLGPLANNGGPTLTHALLAQSPALDAGSNPDELASDQRGAEFARKSGPGVDIGAYELQVTPSVQFTVAAQSGAEDGAPMTVTVEIPWAVEDDVTVPFTLGGTALNGTDYTIDASPIVILAGQTTASVTLTPTDENVVEADETVVLTLGTPTGANLGSITEQTVTIENDDSATLSIGDAQIIEGTGNGLEMVFTVTLSNESDQTVTVDYATADGTATAADYTAKSGQLTFAPGETTQTIRVAITPDALDEIDETFTVALSGAANATISDDEGLGTIEDDDDPPTLSIGDVAVVEGDDGTVEAVFTATLSAESGKTVTVEYATADDTALAGVDYAAETGVLTFAPGVTTQTIRVALLGDLLDELAETFVVDLFDADNATIDDGHAVATITDNDPTPTVAFAAAAQSGGEGSGTITITVSLSAPSGLEVTVPFTVSGTATAPADYAVTASPLVIPAGATSGTITLMLVDDAVDEANETVVVTLGTPTNATLGQTVTHTATITDDDVAGFTVTPIAGLVTTEAGGAAGFTVVLNSRPTADVTIQLASSDASEGTVLPASLTFTPENWNQPQTVTVRGVDDPLADGTVAYTITTAAATSDDPNYDGLNPADVAVSNTDNEPAATNLGKILFREIDDVDLDEGDAWFRVETTYAGFFTLQGFGVDVEVTVYDADSEVVASAQAAGGELRLDPLVEAGTLYYVQLHGTGTDVGLRLVNLVSPEGDTVTVHGTSEADAFTFATGNAHAITIKGVPYNFDPAEVIQITFDGAGGKDNAALTGSDGDDKAVLYPTSGTFSGPDFTVILMSTEETTVEAGDGELDTAILYGSNGDDFFEADPSEGTLSGSGFTLVARGFDFLHGMAQRGKDTAVLHGSAGFDELTAREVYTHLTGEGYLIRARGFDTVTTHGTPQGGDVAYLFDGEDDDVFTATPTQSTLATPRVTNTAVGFDYVHAIARSGGNDKAVLNDGPGKDKFVAHPLYSYIVGEAYFYRANRFEEVRAYGASDGDNVALMYDSPGDDAFTTGVGESVLSGTGFSNTAVAFKSVYGYATAGGYDTAELHDAPGVTALWAKPTSTTLSGAGFYRRAEGFDHLYAQSDDGLDYTEVTDSAADDLLTAAIENGKTKVSMKYAVEEGDPGYNAALDYYYEAIGFKLTKATSIGGTDRRDIASDVPDVEWLGEWEA